MSRPSLLGAVLLAACPIDSAPSTDTGATSGVDFSTTGGSSSPSSTATASDTSPDTSGDAQTTAVADTTGGTDGCSVASPCDVGFCVAPYADNDRGAFVCVPDCVEAGDETSWCFDAAACCDPTATCTERGYCVGADDTDGGSSGGSSGGGSSSGG